jgi:hypothetical protein
VAVGPEELADFLTITPRHVQRLAAEDILPKDARGLYPFARAVRAYFRRVHYQALLSRHRRLGGSAGDDIH